MNKTLAITALCGVVFLSACGNAGNKTADAKPVQTETTVAVETKKTATIAPMVSHYLELKNALVNSNGKQAAAASQEVGKALAAMDKSSFTAEQQKVFTDNQEDLKEHAEHIGNTTDVKHQREHFSGLSEDVFALTKAFGSGQTLYKDNCPMFNDKKGAIWLSEVKDIKNPYYGSKMLTCGKMVSEIK